MNRDRSKYTIIMFVEKVEKRTGISLAIVRVVYPIDCDQLTCYKIYIVTVAEITTVFFNSKIFNEQHLTSRYRFWESRDSHGYLPDQ